MAQAIRRLQKQIHQLQNQQRNQNKTVDQLPPLAEFAQKYFPDYFSAPKSKFHDWLISRLEGLLDSRNQQISVIAPRGAAKSTWSSFVFPLFCAVFGLEKYTIITSDTGIQAKLFLDAIRAELETNTRLREDFFGIATTGRTWRQDRIILGNGCAIEALGTGTKLRGRRNRDARPSLIIVDDPQNTGHILSPLQRERSWEWLTKDVCNAGDPETNIIVLGTALHRECIVNRLETTAGWEHYLFRSIESWPEQMDLWQEWEGIYTDWESNNREKQAREFFQSHKKDMLAGATVLWPERFPLYDLMCRRVSIGTAAFNSEQQGSPIDPSLCEWPEDYFTHPNFYFEKWPSDLVVSVLSLDPSKGKDAKHGDYQAFVKYGRDRHGIEYVEADLRRCDTQSMCGQAVQLYRDFSPERLGLEANAWQDLLAPQINELARKFNLEIPITLLNNHVKKEVRIRRLTKPLSERRFRFKAKSPGTALLVQQLKDFPNADFDDGPDSLEMARRIAIELMKK